MQLYWIQLYWTQYKLIKVSQSDCIQKTEQKQKQKRFFFKKNQKKDCNSSENVYNSK